MSLCAPMPLNIGARVGTYEITATIGAGGMGEVYRARDTALHRDVAIKVLTDSFATDPDRLARFAREAQVLASLNHPHIAQIYGIEGSRALVMELVDGPTLADRLAKGPLPVDEALRLGIQICDALDTAHRQGIVHRDVKPANVALTRTGASRQSAPQAKLLDFGLAKPPASPAVDATLSSQRAITVEGTILGTVQYMAPEQVQGREADARSDLFAFGAVMYEMLTGQRPFQGDNPALIIAAILDRQPPPIAARVPRIPPRLARTIMTCLEKDPQDRWQSAKDLLRELRWIAEEGAAPQQPATRVGGVTRREWLLAAIAIAGVGSAAWMWQARGTTTAPPVNATPVIVLMDSQHPQRVYDDATRKAGGTNADDLTDLLRDLPVILSKENTGPAWHREDQVLRQNPDVILIHRSCFYDATMLGDGLDEKFVDKLYPAAADKLDLWLGYVAARNPRTRIIVYSRRSWATAAERDAWVASVVRRFPALEGRLAGWMVPLDRATFRHPVTGAEFKKEVRALLGTREAR